MLSGQTSRPVWRCLRSWALPPALVYLGQERAAVPHCQALGLWSLCVPLQCPVPDQGERKGIREDFKVWGIFFDMKAPLRKAISFFFSKEKKGETKWEHINTCKPRPRALCTNISRRARQDVNEMWALVCTEKTTSAEKGEGGRKRDTGKRKCYRKVRRPEGKNQEPVQ